MILIILLVFIIVGPISSETSDSQIVPFISNGDAASIGQFPYVALLKTLEILCGGTIISESKVLSAAHCVFNKDRKKVIAYQIFITVGTIYESTRPYTRAKSFAVHPSYKHEPEKGYAEYDLSVIIVEQNFVFSDLVKSIDLTTIEVNEGDECVVAGFGVTHFRHKRIPGRLLYTNVNVNNLTYCQTAFATFSTDTVSITNEMICAGAFDKGDPCNGDSGSGLICHGAVAGIVSFGPNCGAPGVPGVYMSVYHFRDWIHKAAAISHFTYTKSFIMITTTTILTILVNSHYQ